MKKLLVLSAALILVGAGCSNATPNDQAINPNQNNSPVSQTATGEKQNKPAAQEVVNNNPSTAGQVETNTGSPVASAVPSFTLAEVAANNSPSKCWTAVNGSVYDVTTYAPKHPGGKEKVYEICGKDGTAAFNGMHGMSDKAKAAMEKLKIGLLK